MKTSEDVVRSVYENLERGDLKSVIEAFDEDAEIDFIGSDSIPFAGRYHGKQGMNEMLGKLNDSSELLEFGPDEFHASGEFVTVLGHEHGRSRQTGREWRTPLTDTFLVRDGRIRQLRCMYDTAEVERAFAAG